MNEELEASTAERLAEVVALKQGLIAVEELINNSRSVHGLHLNGDEAPWDELRTGGRFEAWLFDFDRALEIARRPE